MVLPTSCCNTRINVHPLLWAPNWTPQIETPEYVEKRTAPRLSWGVYEGPVGPRNRFVMNMAQSTVDNSEKQYQQHLRTC